MGLGMILVEVTQSQKETYCIIFPQVDLSYNIYRHTCEPMYAQV